MLKTRITELFGIEKPIVQGGLMWIAMAELASAVANAGGIGFMTALTFQEAEDLRAEIRKCRKMTNKPFGVNLTFLPSLRTIDYPAYIKVCIEEIFSLLIFTGILAVMECTLILSQRGINAGVSMVNPLLSSFSGSKMQLVTCFH